MIEMPFPPFPAADDFVASETGATFSSAQADASSTAKTQSNGSTGQPPKEPPAPPADASQARGPEPEAAVFERTRISAAVAAIIEASKKWAEATQHPIVSQEDFFTVFARMQPRALQTAGVVDPALLAETLGGLTMRPRVGEEASASPPVVHNSVWALLDHAGGYARDKGEDIIEPEDVVDAIFAAVSRPELDSAAANVLRRHWPKLADAAATRQILPLIREEIRSLPAAMQAIGQHLYAINQRLAEQKAAVDQCAEQIVVANDRIAALEPKAAAAPTRKLLPVLRVAAIGLVVTVMGASLFAYAITP